MTNERMLSEEDEELLGVVEDPISQVLISHAQFPHNVGVLEDAHGGMAVTGICEDTVAVQVRLREQTIEAIRFQADGCGFTRACGSMATELVKGKSVAFARQLSGAQIGEALGGLPLEHTHCADLAANAVREATRNALLNYAAPWRKVYGKD